MLISIYLINDTWWAHKNNVKVIINEVTVEKKKKKKDYRTK